MKIWVIVSSMYAMDRKMSQRYDYPTSQHIKIFNIKVGTAHNDLQNLRLMIVYLLFSVYILIKMITSFIFMMMRLVTCY